LHLYLLGISIINNDFIKSVAEIFQMKVVGIDEAGKGPVIGPMVVCGVLCEESNLSKLKKAGVKDSKKLKPERRRELAEVIKKFCKICLIKITPEEIDRSDNINDLLRESYVKIIEKLDPDLVIVDSPDVKPERLKEFLERMTGKKVISKHKADEEFVAVAAASIVAKVERDAEIDRLKREYGDFGSGYASDPKTIKFLEEWIKRGKIPPIVRRRWRTVGRLSQHSLEEFIS